MGAPCRPSYSTSGKAIRLNSNFQSWVRIFEFTAVIPGFILHALGLEFEASVGVFHYLSDIYLVNTGWIGGPYGIGKRININDTRKCIDAILSGEILNSKFSKELIFNLEIPIHINGMDQNILIPENSWDDKKNYHKYATKLSNMFKDNYNKLFRQTNIKDYSIFGPN